MVLKFAVGGGHFPSNQSSVVTCHPTHALHLFLHFKANVNPLDRWGNTPLDDAIRHQHEDTIDFLQTVGGEEGSAMAVRVETRTKKATLLEMANWAVTSPSGKRGLEHVVNAGSKLLGSKVMKHVNLLHRKILRCSCLYHSTLGRFRGLRRPGNERHDWVCDRHGRRYGRCW